MAPPIEAPLLEIVDRATPALGIIKNASTAISAPTRGMDGDTYSLLDITDGNVVRLMEYAQNQFQEKRLDKFFFDDRQWIHLTPER